MNKDFGETQHTFWQEEKALLSNRQNGFDLSTGDVGDVSTIAGSKRFIPLKTRWIEVQLCLVGATSITFCNLLSAFSSIGIPVALSQTEHLASDERWVKTDGVFKTYCDRNCTAHCHTAVLFFPATNSSYSCLMHPRLYLSISEQFVQVHTKHVPLLGCTQHVNTC
jgi:hypothetical protein